MKTKHHIIFIISLCLLILVSIPSFAQEGKIGGEGTLISDYLDPGFQNTNLRYEARYDQYSGSPFLFDEWRLSLLKMSSGKTLSGLKVMYDAYAQRLVVKQEEDQMLLSDAAVKSFILYDENAREFHFKKFDLGPGLKGVFGEELFNGVDMLVVKYQEITLNRQENNAGGYGGGSNANEIQTFSAKPNYFIKPEPGADFTNFSPNKKGVLALFPDKKLDIIHLVKKEKLKYNNDGDLRKIFQLVEQLND